MVEYHRCGFEIFQGGLFDSCENFLSRVRKRMVSIVIKSVLTQHLRKGVLSNLFTSVSSSVPAIFAREPGSFKENTISAAAYATGFPKICRNSRFKNCHFSSAYFLLALLKDL